MLKKVCTFVCVCSTGCTICQIIHARKQQRQLKVWYTHTHTHIIYIYIYSSIVLKSITCNVTVAQMRAPCNHHRAAISGRLSGRISKVVICSQAHFQSDAGLAARPPDLERGPHHLQTSALFGIFSNGTI